MWTLTDIKEQVKLLKYFKSQGVLQENIIGQKGSADKKSLVITALMKNKWDTKNT